MNGATQARVEAAAALAAARSAERLADAIRDAVPGAQVEVDQGRVTVSGRALWRRLRWPGGYLR